MNPRRRPDRYGGHIVKRLTPRKIALSGAFAALAGFLVLGSVSRAVALESFRHGIVDEPAGDGEMLDGPSEDEPGLAQRPRAGGEPSEDGTEDGPAIEPGPALPDAPPGCIFHGGPLELVV
jgi:hypothetical protein